MTPDKLVEQTARKITIAQNSILSLEEDRSELVLKLEEYPDDKDAQASLKKTEADLKALKEKLEGLNGALLLAQQRDVKAEEDTIAAAIAEANRETRALLEQKQKTAPQIDKAIAALVTALQNEAALNHRIARSSYDAGLRGDQRLHMLSLRAAGGVLAYQLASTRLAEQLELALGGNTLPKSYEEVVNHATKNMAAWLDHAERSTKGADK